MRRPSYSIVDRECTPECLVIRDLGPWDRHPTVTNAAEQVVEELAHLLPRGRRLEYYDSEGERGQLLHLGGVFAGFMPAVLMERITQGD